MTREELKRESIKAVRDIQNKRKKLLRLSSLKQIAIEIATKKVRERYDKKIVPLVKEVGVLKRKQWHFQDICRKSVWCEIGLGGFHGEIFYGICSLCGFTRRPKPDYGNQAHP